MYGLTGSSREDWNEDWAIVDGAGYFDFQELEEGLFFCFKLKCIVVYDVSMSLKMQNM